MPCFYPPMLIIIRRAWKPSNEHDDCVGNADLMEFEVYDQPMQDLGNTFLHGNINSPEDTDMEDDTNTREPSTSQLAFINAIRVLTHTQKLQIFHTVRKTLSMEVSDICERIQKRSTTYGMTLEERAVFNYYRTLRGKSTVE